MPYRSTMSDSREGDLNFIQLQKVAEIDISKVAQIFANLNRRRLFMLNSLLYDTKLNINSIRNKFNYHSEQIRGNVDISLVWETKIDDSFPQGQFVIDGFNVPYRLHRNCLGGGLMLFVRDDILSNLLTIEEKPIESFYVELNLRNSKWLVNCSYNPHKNSIGKHLDRKS